MSYNKPFELPGESERLTDTSDSYLPPQSQNLIQDVLNNSLSTNGKVIYTITPVNVNGCEGIPASITITIKISPLLR